jgi:hypothetical protein
MHLDFKSGRGVPEVVVALREVAELSETPLSLL